jgi:nitrogenase molybdenum-iron protein alpha/beta subunit
LPSGFRQCRTTPSLSKEGKRRHQSRQINVLCGSSLTPGDLEALRELIERFGLHPVLIPDLADSLDGHLDAEDYSPLTTGGTPLAAFTTLGDAAATLVIGASLNAAADLLQERTGVPTHRFPHLFGLEATDRLVMTLAGIAGQPVSGDCGPAAGRSYRTLCSIPIFCSDGRGSLLPPIRIYCTVSVSCWRKWVQKSSLR